MFKATRTTGSDDGNPNSVSDASRQIEIVTVLGSVRVHARQENFSCSEVRDRFRPFDGIAIRSYPAAMCVHLCTAVFPAGIDGNDNALAAKSLRRSLNECGIIDCRRVERYFIGTTA